jgi:hypothetical protein
MQQNSGKRKAARTTAKAAPAALPSNANAAISLVAYSLYEARGCVDGHALEDWLEAEAQVGQGADPAGAHPTEARLAAVA